MSYDIWSEWGTCDISCSSNCCRRKTRNCIKGDCDSLTSAHSWNSYREEKCKTGSCEYGGNLSPTLFSVFVSSKNLGPNFNNWSSWSCNTECGDGTQTRTRNCLTNCDNLDSDIFPLSENMACQWRACE